MDQSVDELISPAEKLSTNDQQTLASMSMKLLKKVYEILIFLLTKVDIERDASLSIILEIFSHWATLEWNYHILSSWSLREFRFMSFYFSYCFNCFLTVETS